VCSKVLTSMVMQAGGESYEMKLSVAIGLLGTVACYVLLDYSDAFLDFRVNSGFAEFREVFGRFLKARVEGESLLNVTISHEEVSTAITWLKTIFALVGTPLLSFMSMSDGVQLLLNRCRSMAQEDCWRPCRSCLRSESLDAITCCSCPRSSASTRTPLVLAFVLVLFDEGMRLIDWLQ